MFHQVRLRRVPNFSSPLLRGCQRHCKLGRERKGAGATHSDERSWLSYFDCSHYGKSCFLIWWQLRWKWAQVSTLPTSIPLELFEQKGAKIGPSHSAKYQNRTFENCSRVTDCKGTAKTSNWREEETDYFCTIIWSRVLEINWIALNSTKTSTRGS
jgi:hypothetical protein